MKSFFVLTILAFLNVLGFAQNSGVAKYKIKYGNSELSDTNATLRFKGGSSLFETSVGPNNTFSLVIHDTLRNLENRLNNSIANKSIVYTNLLDNKIITSNELFLSNVYYTLEEPLSIKWEIHKDTKNIGKFVCHKATCKFRGREYTAWFTHEIPVKLGPWKFNGLPGLILEINEKDMHLQIKLSSIDILDEKRIEPLNSNNLISVSEYLKLFKSEVHKLTPDHPARHRPSVITYIDISNFTELETSFK